MPEAAFAEYWLGTDPGVPLEEVCPISGVAMPVGGTLVPTDAPGFGMEIKADWITPYSGQVGEVDVALRSLWLITQDLGNQMCGLIHQTILKRRMKLNLPK